MAILMKEPQALNSGSDKRFRLPLRGRKGQSRTVRFVWRQPYALLLASLLSFMGAPLARAQEGASGEYQLKAAFLFNFAKFIDWPSTSFPNPQSPFVVCILGTDPFGHVIDEVLKGKAIADRPVAIERIKTIAQVRQCQMVFVSQSESFHLANIVQGTHGACVLLVGEADGFAEAGGTIQFALEDDHVRFLINPDAAARAGLKVSSKLLSLARVIHDSDKGAGS
jgi:YfiR/HmsC-like